MAPADRSSHRARPVLAAYGGGTQTELEVIADGVIAAAVRLSGDSLLATARLAKALPAAWRSAWARLARAESW